jgi:hypothetical protein
VLLATLLELKLLLDNGGDFVNRELVISDFVFSGISTTGLRVRRLSNNEAFIYNFPSAIGTIPATSGIGVAAKALRIGQTQAPTVAAVANSGIATVAAANLVVKSGTAFGDGSGIQFTVTLTDDYFRTAGVQYIYFWY